jgi:hypothetical protein
LDLPAEVHELPVHHHQLRSPAHHTPRCGLASPVGWLAWWTLGGSNENYQKTIYVSIVKNKMKYIRFKKKMAGNFNFYTNLAIIFETAAQNPF